MVEVNNLLLNKTIENKVAEPFKKAVKLKMFPYLFQIAKIIYFPHIYELTFRNTVSCFNEIAQAN